MLHQQRALPDAVPVSLHGMQTKFAACLLVFQKYEHRIQSHDNHVHCLLDEISPCSIIDPTICMTSPKNIEGRKVHTAWYNRRKIIKSSAESLKPLDPRFSGELRTSFASKAALTRLAELP